MNKYANGKIYAIKSAHQPLPYYGSTTYPLNTRFSLHKSQYKQYLKGALKTICSSEKHLQYPDVFIELVEDYPCSSEKELTKRELEYIQTNPCVNIRGKGPQWSVDKYKNYQKEWRLKHPNYQKNYKKRKLNTKNNIHSQLTDNPQDVLVQMASPNTHLNTSLLPMFVLLATVLHKLQNTFVKLHPHI